jgi:hypothetical protein
MTKTYQVTFWETAGRAGHVNTMLTEMVQILHVKAGTADTRLDFNGVLTKRYKIIRCWSEYFECKAPMGGLETSTRWIVKHDLVVSLHRATALQKQRSEKE